MDHPDYMIDHIVFEKDSWRKLHSIERIDFAPRITVIAGLNGIGKSTLLGLCANCLGFTGKSRALGDNFSSYFGAKFQADFDKIFTLTEADTKQRGRSLIYVKRKDGDFIIKGCNVSKVNEKTDDKTKKPRLRVVARTMVEDNGTWKNSDEKPDGASAKIPLPVLYLGMSRVWPIGESDEKDRGVRNLKIDEDDARYIHDLVNSIIPVGCRDEIGVEEVSVSGISSRKHRLLQPKLNFPTLAMSLGQGALGTIVTALASFRHLKRELKDKYPGGLLVIDELDSGFHPSAQIDLVNVLAREARLLKLQVLATSHSPVLLRAVDDLRTKSLMDPQDDIVYLADSRRPKWLKIPFSEILQELLLEKVETKKEKVVVYAYTEDKEAAELLSIIAKKRGSPLKAMTSTVQIKYCSLNLGNDQLKQLVNNKSLPHFRKEAVCVLDGDIRLPKTKALIINLPTINNEKRSPEEEFLFYVKSLIEGKFEESGNALRTEHINSDYLDRHIIGKIPKNQDRVMMKKWYNEVDKNLRISIWKRWLSDNDNSCSIFLEELKNKIGQVQKIAK